MIQKIRNKHGLSEVISYVLLVLLALAVSVLIYGYFELQTPKERPQCPDGVSLALQEYSCTLTPKKACLGTPQGGKGKIDITLANNGKRSVSGVYLRIGAPDRKVKELLNKESPFFGFNPQTGGTTLPPNGVIKKNYSLALQNEIAVGQQGLEIEPVIGTPGNLALCEKSTVTRTITCDLPSLENVPSVVPGTYVLLYQKVYGSAKITVTPDASYTEGVDYLETALCRNSDGKCVPESLPRKVSCPDINGKYVLEWGVLGAGDYQMSSVLVLINGARIPIAQGSSSGSTIYSFHIWECIGTCESDETGVRVRRNSDGTVLCSQSNVCSSNQWRYWYCNDRCYTGNPSLDSQIFGLLLYGCTSCSNQYSCGGSLTSVSGPFYGGCSV